MDKDRRRALRTASQIPVDLYDAKGKAITAEGQFINVSTTGAMIETPKPLKVKDRLRLRFQPGKEPLFDVNGSVVWVVKKRRSFQCGVQFAPGVASALYKASHA
jgi:PilZ domain